MEIKGKDIIQITDGDSKHGKIVTLDQLKEFFVPKKVVKKKVPAKPKTKVTKAEAKAADK
jgi:hypothetical protein